MKMLSRRALMLLFALIGLPSAASFSVASITELADDASAIYLLNVKEVIDPKWVDETGQRVLIATSSVERTIKGQSRIDLALAFKPTVSDLPKFAVANRYLVFVYGAQSSIVLPQRTAALSLKGDEVDTGGLRSEPRMQPLSRVLARLGIAVSQ